MVLALTGGIACGKSTVTEILQSQGNWGVIDSDLIAHRLMEPDAENWQKIVDAFGPDVLSANRTVNRRFLGDLVFNHPHLREQLNALTHPAIRRAWQEERVAFVRDHPEQSLVVVIPLLFEKELQNEFSQVLAIGCSSQLQRERLQSRGWDDAQITARIQSQWPLVEKMKRAHLVLWNEGTRGMLARQVARIMHPTDSNN